MTNSTATLPPTTASTPTTRRQAKDFAKWHDSHKPFHWFVEFHEIMQGGGFDIVISGIRHMWNTARCVKPIK